MAVEVHDEREREFADVFAYRSAGRFLDLTGQFIQGGKSLFFVAALKSIEGGLAYILREFDFQEGEVITGFASKEFAPATNGAVIGVESFLFSAALFETFSALVKVFGGFTTFDPSAFLDRKSVV